MNPTRKFPLLPLMLALLTLGLVLAPGARADDDVQVAAALAADAQPEVGQSVDFTITVSGATEATVPENVNVDGLTITYVGPNTQTQIQFGTGFGSGSHIQRSVTHTYSVVPQRAGEFVIPAQKIVVDGKDYATRPVTVRVGANASSGTAGGDQNGQLYFAEVVVPKNSAYIGEALPLEFRLYLDARIPGQLEEQPELSANGCTLQKIGKPTQSQVTRNGRQYVMVTFKTAATAARAGKLTLGPSTIQLMARIPQGHKRRRTGGPFDDPMFQNPFFDDAFQMLSQPQQITAKAEPVDLDIKPLPAAGQPRSFGGAVGNYSLTTTVKPAMVEAGDPITITANITGRGDFDRVTAPQFTDPNGWKTYPPSAKFEQDDDTGISGTKTFQMAVIPDAGKKQSPTLEWSFFDPIKEQYVTLSDRGVPIKIEGTAAAQSTPAIAQQSAAAAKPTPAQAGPDIMYIRADSDGWDRTFTPLYTTRVFWAAQGAPLVVLLAFIGVRIARKRASDEEARRRDQWRREKDAELAKLNRREAPESDLYDAAASALRLDAAILTGRTPSTLHPAEVTAARALDAATAERVRNIFDRQAEALYAGASGSRATASAETRVALLEIVKAYENAPHEKLD
jgi:hypothetical protein